jgi:hypothetical protein
MNKIRNIIAYSAFSLMVLALPSIASAQWNGGGYPYPNNGGVYSGGRYGNRDLDRVSERIKDNARDLERLIDRETRYNGRYGNTGILGTILGSGGYNNRGYGNDNIRRLANDFRRAADQFENRMDDNDNGRYGRNGRWDRGDSRDQQSAQRLLSIGSQLENELRRFRMSSQLQREWSQIRQDLNVVASSYGRGGRNGRFPF